jgi:uncharacterized protein (TIGR00730 family)
MTKRLCVFCGSQMGFDPVYANEARQLGKAMVKRGIELVFGAGHIGLMGVIADAVLEAGGRATGVIPQNLVDRELAHQGLTSLRIVSSMHQRKALMADLSDAFVALPGGYGTADELFEILTWKQLKLHAKPIGLLNTARFFDPLLGWVDHAIASGFVKGKYRDYLVVESDADLLLECLLPQPA